MNTFCPYCNQEIEIPLNSDSPIHFCSSDCAVAFEKAALREKTNVEDRIFVEIEREADFVPYPIV